MWGLWLVSGNSGMVVVASGGHEWWMVSLLVVFAFAWKKRDTKKERKRC